MAKKFYAVRAGRNPGLYTRWEDCKAQVDGYPRAVFQGFATRAAAEAYLADEQEAHSSLEAGEMLAYVDGSYEAATGRYACGAVLITCEGETELQAAYDDAAASALHNVAGEIMGARLAIERALADGIQRLTIYHDYTGIGQWGNDAWKANLDMTRAYKAFVAEARQRMEIRFVKVKGHSGDPYNERADALARGALER